MKKVFFKIAAFALALLSVAALSACGEKEKVDEKFKLPDSYAAVVKVTIDGSVKFYLDESDKVISIEYLDGKSLSIYKDLRGKVEKSDIAEAVVMLAKTAVKQDTLTKGKTVNVNILSIIDLTKLDALAYKLDMALTSFVSDNKLKDVTVCVLYKGDDVQKAHEKKYDLMAEENEETAVEDTDSENTVSAYLNKPKPDTFEKSFKHYIAQTDSLNIISLNFFEDFTCSYVNTKYTLKQTDGSMSISYNGSTWYEESSNGSMGTFKKSKNKLVVTDNATGAKITFKYNKDGTVTVAKASAWKDTFTENTVLSPV